VRLETAVVHARLIVIAHAQLTPGARAPSIAAVTSPKPIIQNGKSGGRAQNDERKARRKTG
jgi:hypothetical protein